MGPAAGISGDVPCGHVGYLLPVVRSCGCKSMQQQSGKGVYAGMHVSSGSVGPSFPASCNATFTPDEKALAFLLFDLTNCVGSIF